MEKETKTYFVVEIGGAEIYFERLQEASDFFAKLAGTSGQKIGRLGYGDNAYYFQDGKYTPSMKQENIDVYKTKKAAEFAKHESGDKDD